MDLSRRKYLTGVLGVSTIGLAGCGSDGSQEPSKQDGPFAFNRPTLGEKDAPVTMIYWGDYQCHFCQKFEEETQPEINTNHIETGEVRLIFKPIAVFGKDSERAAQAAHCVWEMASKEVFWEWHTKIMSHSNKDTEGWASIENLVKLSEDIDGVDVDKLESCIRDGKYSSRLNTDLTEGKERGLEGTPYFFIYGKSAKAGQKLSGAQSYNFFNRIINNYT